MVIAKIILIKIKKYTIIPTVILLNIIAFETLRNAV